MGESDQQEEEVTRVIAIGLAVHVGVGVRLDDQESEADDTQDQLEEFAGSLLRLEVPGVDDHD